MTIENYKEKALYDLQDLGFDFIRLKESMSPSSNGPVVNRRPLNVTAGQSRILLRERRTSIFPKKYADKIYARSASRRTNKGIEISVLLRLGERPERPHLRNF